MRVLAIAERCWPEGTGGILAIHLVLGLLKDVFEIMVATGTKRPERVEGVRYAYVPCLDAPSKIHLWASLLKPDGKLGELVKQTDVVYVPRLAYPLIPLAKRYNKKVIVHIFDYQLISYNAVIMSSLRGSPLDRLGEEARFELLEHGSAARALAGSLLALTNRLCRAWVAQADRVICVSKDHCHIMSSTAPELARKLRVIYSPPPSVPLAEKRLGEPRIVYVGGDSYVKGFHVLLSACQKALRRHPSLGLLLAGNYRAASRRVIRKLNEQSGGAYSLLGRLTHEELLKLHSVSHALLFPSICRDTLCYGVMESMLAGTIPIASRTGGIPEIVQGTYAEKMLVKPGSVDDIVDRVETVLSLPNDQLMDIGMELRRNTIARFDNELIKRQLLDVFNP